MKEYQYLSEANWYMKWALTFIVMAIICELLMFYEWLGGQIKSGMIMLGLAFCSYMMAGRCKRKADDLARKADRI